MTLIEVMVTLAIIGIIAAIAWPQFEGTRERSRRNEGVATVLLAHAYLEKCYSRVRDYTDTSCDLPAELTTSAQNNYDIGFQSRTADAYELRATPKAGGNQTGDTDCAILSITNTGDKSASTNTYCWPE